ncbi:MAG: thioredoxin family protein [Bacteroidota bacterium]
MLRTKLLAVVCLMLFFAGTTPKKGYEVGDKAIDFKLKNVDGKMVSMADYKNAKGFIVVFTCNTCPYSQMYEQRIIDLHNMYAEKGFPVIAINSNDPMRQPGDSFDEMVKLAKNQKYPFPYVYDNTQEIAKAYGATNTPHVYILGKDGGSLVVNYIGAIDNNARSASDVTEKYVENAVNALMGDKDVEVKKTKAIGCTIKWKAS